MDARRRARFVASRPREVSRRPGCVGGHLSRGRAGTHRAGALDARVPSRTASTPDKPGRIWREATEQLPHLSMDDRPEPVTAPGRREIQTERDTGGNGALRVAG